MSSVDISTTKLVAVMLGVSIISAGVTAVAITSLSPSPIAPGAGTLTGSDVLTIDSQELLYSGNNVTDVNVSVNNTDTTSHTVDIHVALINTTSGETVRSETITGVSIGAGTVKTSTVTLTNSVSVSKFDKVEVTVEQTG